MKLQQYLWSVIKTEIKAIYEQLRESKSLLIAFLACLVGIVFYLQPFPDRHIYIGTADEGSAWFSIGQHAATYLDQHGLDSKVVSTDGAVENINLLIDPDSPVNAALTYGIALDDSQRSSIVSLGSVAYEPIWIFYRKDRVKLNSPHDLERYRVGLGPTDSGSYVIARKLMAIYGISIENNPHFIPDSFLKTEEKFVAGDIDALIIVSTVNDPIVQKLMRLSNVGLFSFENAHAFAKKFNALEAVTLPAGSINIYPPIPSQDISLISTTSSVAVKKEMHPDLQLALLMTIREINRNATNLFFAKRDEFPAYVDPTIPISPVAARFYDYGPPQMMRYLPFWVAGFIDRAWILLLTLVAVFYPLSKLNLHIRKLRFIIHERPYYEELLDIDKMLSTRKLTEAEKESVKERLASINDHAIKHGVPIGEELHHFDLVKAIDLLRRKLEIN